MDVRHIKTAVFGTGETGYKHYCAAVDQFRDMLFVNSKLVATIKVEQMWQEADLQRIDKFCNIFQSKFEDNTIN